jgi:rod shape-determining protein MreD
VTLRQGVLRGSLLLLAALAAAVAGTRALVLPDLLAVVVGALALRMGWRTGAGAGLAAGWVSDLLPPGALLLGLSALTYAVAGLLAGRLHRRGAAPALLLAWSVLLTALVVEAVGVVIALTQGAPVDVQQVALRLALTATTGLLLGPLVIRVDRRADRPR